MSAPGIGGSGARDPVSASQALSLLRAIVAFPRTLRLYPSHDARIERHARRLARLSTVLMRDRRAPIAFELREGAVACDGAPLVGNPELIDEFVRMLGGREARALVLHPGVGPGDFRAVGAWFAYPPADGAPPPAVPGLDLVSVQKEARDGPAGDRAAGGPARPPRPSVAPQRRKRGGPVERVEVELPADPQRLATLLESMQATTRLDEARGLIARVGLRDDAFDVLTGLLASGLPGVLRRAVLRTLSVRARARRGTWTRWVLDDPEVLFLPRLFGLLARRCPDLLAPAVDELLARGQGEIRRRVLEALVAEGGEHSLRMLVRGVTYDTSARDTVVLEALGSFRHSLAIGVLREVIHRCNTQAMRPDEARGAMTALERIESDEAHAFVEEIATSRAGLLPRYRRELRCLAKDILARR